MDNNKKGVGRKPHKDKKVTINLYVLQSIVDTFGDGYDLRDFLYKCIEDKVNGVPDLNQMNDKALLTEMLDWWKIEGRNKRINAWLDLNDKAENDAISNDDNKILNKK